MHYLAQKKKRKVLFIYSNTTKTIQMESQSLGVNKIQSYSKQTN